VIRFCILFGTALTLASCGPSAERGPLGVAIIGEPESLFQEGVRLSPAGQYLRSSTNEGLVALDSAGEIIPAIAERWIVTDDGLSYIFRLRDSNWPDGEPITAADVRTLLRAAIRDVDGTSLGLDLAKITEVRAMTGRVVELRLSSPMPEFLRLLAQPELGFVNRGSGAGPMVLSRDEGAPIARLSALPPQERGLSAREDWQDIARTLTVRALPAQPAVDAFASGEIDLLLNGRLVDFPLAEQGPLSRGTIQVDPSLGLLGLVVRSDTGVLADPQRREALSMAIDRDQLIQPFGLGGWQTAEWIVPAPLFVPAQYPAGRWNDLDIQERREVARGRISQWETASGEQAAVRVALPIGPGSDLMFDQLSAAWQTIGVTAVQVASGEAAELELHDRLARYSSPRWFLNQFNCTLDLGLCSPEADELVRQSLEQLDPAAKQLLLANAHAQLMAQEVYIPLGVPVRWSLVRGAVRAFQANVWGFHPLFPLSQPTI
jgi:ABC-type oligopeptide transport system substrate-binding subunit